MGLVSPYWGYGYGYGHYGVGGIGGAVLIILLVLACLLALMLSVRMLHGVARWAEMRHNPQPMGRKN